MDEAVSELEKQIEIKLIDVKKEPDISEVDITNDNNVLANNSAVIGGSKRPDTDPDPDLDLDPDETDCSSSFANTDSDNDKGSEPSEADKESQFFGDSDFPFPNAFNGTIQERKKKLTNHWRNFIHPLMWRCKWLELKIKEIDSQILRYNGKLAAYEELKEAEICQQVTEGCCSKSIPFNFPFSKEKAAKRRKRKRVEDSTDATVYMSGHVIFSYLENHKNNQDGITIHDDHVQTATRKRLDEDEIFGIDSNRDLVHFRVGDPFEDVLITIELVQSRVQKLKNKLEMLLPKSSPAVSSSEDLSLADPYDDAETGFPHSPTFSHCDDETFSMETMKTATHVPGYEFGDLDLPECRTQCYGETIHVPDIIESTVGLLTAADVSCQQSQLGDSSEDILDNILMTNSEGTGEADYHINSSDAKNEDENQLPEDALTKEEESSLQATLLSDSQLAGNKRKRGERKGTSTGWSKKPHDDSDNS